MDNMRQQAVVVDAVISLRHKCEGAGRDANSRGEGSDK